MSNYFFLGSGVGAVGCGGIKIKCAIAFGTSEADRLFFNIEILPLLLKKTFAYLCVPLCALCVKKKI
jgi:hypothetical protein